MTVYIFSLEDLLAVLSCEAWSSWTCIPTVANLLALVSASSSPYTEPYCFIPRTHTQPPSRHHHWPLRWQIVEMNPNSLKWFPQGHFLNNAFNKCSKSQIFNVIWFLLKYYKNITKLHLFANCCYVACS